MAASIQPAQYPPLHQIMERTSKVSNVNDFFDPLIYKKAKELPPLIAG